MHINSRWRWLALGLVAAGGLAGYYFLNALASFLLLALVCLVAWPILWATVGAGLPREARRIRYGMYSAGLLSVVYIAGILVLNAYLRPRDAHPYFLNTDYHFLANTGVTYGGRLRLLTADTTSAAPGLYASEGGTLDAGIDEQGRTILTGHGLLTPVFMRVQGLKGGKDSMFSVVNVPFKASLRNDFTISNEVSQLTLHITEADSLKRQFGIALPARLGTNSRTIVTGTFTSWDTARLRVFGIGNSFSATFRLYHTRKLHTGYSLHDLLMNTEHWEASPAETRQLLADWLDALGPCSILARYRKVSETVTKDFVFFPSPQFVDEGYKLKVAGASETYDPLMNEPVPAGAEIYCGLNALRDRFRLSRDAAGRARLTFSEPHYHSLRLQEAAGGPPGAQYARGLYNHYTAFFYSPGDEGYLFAEDLRKSAGNNISGQLFVTSGRPTQPLDWEVADANRPDLTQKAGSAPEHNFSLAGGKDGDILWQYRIRDFSLEGLSYNAYFWLLTLVYMLSVILLLWRPAKTLKWVEPPLLVILAAFVTFRCILLWRIATMPPAVEGAGKDIRSFTRFELDFIPGAPFTFTFIGLFFLLLFLLRAPRVATWLATTTGREAPGPASDAALIETDTEARERKQGIRRQGARIVGRHLLVLGVCIGIFILGSAAHWEPLVRVGSILMPVCSYLIFMQQLLRLGLGEWQSFYWKRVPRQLHPLAQGLYHIYDSKEALLSLSTLALLLLLDRGFGVMFLLFLLFKNVAVSFARSPLTGRPFREQIAGGLFYWIYGLGAAIIYLVFIYNRSLFHHALLHIRAVGVGAMLLSAILSVLILRRHKVLRWTIPAAVCIVCIVVFGPGWHKTESWIHEQVKYVMHRSSLIYQPAEEVIAGTGYASFEERKILETAESQWFINSYLNMAYDPDRRVNLRPYSDRGVNYITQTRDIVLSRFLIAEHGDAVMYLLILLLLGPVIIWFICYRVYHVSTDPRSKTSRIQFPRLGYRGYSGVLALLLLLTIGVFVWLSATNRFVFFGQDFPFLSITSRIAVVLPLALLLAALCSNPRQALLPVVAAPAVPDGAPLRLQRTSSPRLLRTAIWLGFTAIIGIAIYLTGRSPQLNAPNFTIHMREADSVIGGPVNDLLASIQDTMTRMPRRQAMAGITGEEELTRPDIFKAIDILKDLPEFKAISASTYTRSILDSLVARPAAAFQPRSPVYLRYDDAFDIYTLSYNRNLFLEMPPGDGVREWRGNVCAWVDAGVQDSGAVIRIGNAVPLAHLPAVAGSGGVKVAVLPRSWLSGGARPLAIVGVANDVHNRKDASVQFINVKGAVATQQDAATFAQVLQPGAIAIGKQGRRVFPVRYDIGGRGQLFAKNCYINGRQRLLYPLGARCFWAAQYAKAMRDAYTASGALTKDAPVTLDYNLSQRVAGIVDSFFDTHKVPRTVNGKKEGDADLHPGYRFAVIAADGEGNVRLMADAADSRIRVDPNNEKAMAALETRAFFIHEVAKQREQWANMNLVQMPRGPGSSIKPIIAAAVAGEVNAGWERLSLEGTGTLDDPLRRDGVKHGLQQYAGLPLAPKNVWESSEDGDAEFKPCNFNGYLVHSVNLYHSLLLFLGSYPKQAFADSTGNYSLSHLLIPDNRSDPLESPRLSFDGAPCLLPAWKKDGWPKTADGSGTFFGNPASVLAEGMRRNFPRLAVGDDDKRDYSPYSRALENIGDKRVYDSLQHSHSQGFQWSFPESSDFLQAARAPVGLLSNFKEGLRNPSRGGNPYHITAFKMAELFGALATFNRRYTLRLSPELNTRPDSFITDSRWNGRFRQDFLQAQLWPALAGVLAGGTANDFNKGKVSWEMPGHQPLFCYAKTGTIGNAGKTGQSRRFAIILSTENLAAPQTTAPHIYTIYFTADRISEQKWQLYRDIIDAIVNSDSFRQYMRTPNAVTNVNIHKKNISS